MPEISEVRYARSGDGIDIAYQIIGNGPTDFVFASGFISHLDLIWEVPPIAARYAKLAELGRGIVFDKRGTGLSDRTLGFGSVADRMDDIRAVMDAAGVQQAALFGVSEGGPLALTFAATYPDRVTKLALRGTFARVMWAPDYTIGADAEQTEELLQTVAKNWGTGRALRWIMSDAPDDAVAILARYERSACTPQMAEEILRRNSEIDVRDVLHAINVPTLVMHNTGDPVANVKWGRYLAEHIPGARYIEAESDVHASWTSPGDFPFELHEFLTGEAQSPDLDRMLATVLFTDIVSSTERTAKLGDQAWREVLDNHDRVARSEVDRFRGRLVNTTGDGVLATFDGPARAIGCAQAIGKGVRQLGVAVRAGLHTGEIELRGKDITGLGVVISRRICDLAGEGELLTSRTVKELVTGSGFTFADRGSHALKGVPDDWQLFAVEA